MTKILRRLATVVAGSLVLLSTGYLGFQWYFPVPPSPPLVDRGGVVLDDETQAKLVEIIFQAVREDDLETVDAYLTEGFTPSVRSTRGDTLLAVAAYHDSPKVLSRLLEAPGVEIDARSRMGLTALSGAAFKGNVDAVKLLLKHGADPKATNSVGQTPLMFASLSDRKDVVAILLAAGADPAARAADGSTALSVAEGQGAEQTARLLQAGSKATEPKAP
ncbi:MAG: ankyrin repeat domain-containing protein [Planctomycetia bacterium]